MIRSVDRAVDVLLALQGARSLGVSELAERLRLPKGTVHGLLKTLVGRDLAEQDAVTGKYSLGPALLRMGTAYLEGHELRVRSLRWAEALAEKTGLAVRVGVLVSPEVIVIHHVPRPQGGVQMPEVGIGLPAHATCMGKAILAFAPDHLEAILAEPLGRLTGATITDPGLLRRHLEQVRSELYASEEEEAVLGEAGLASTVFDGAGRVVGAIGVVVPTQEWPGETDPNLVAAVRDHARILSREMGCEVWPPLEVESIAG